MSADTEAYVAVTRLQAAYADVVTRRAWDELSDLFVPDAPIRIDTVTRPVIDVTGPQELADFIAKAVARFEFFEFVILNTVIDIQSDDRATGRLWMLEVRQDVEPRQWSEAFGLYEDDYVVLDGSWRFSRRRYRSLARRTGNDPASVFP